MKEYHTKIEINAPKDVVWNHLIDFEKYIEWNPLVSKITGEIAEGGTIYTTIIPLKETFAAQLLSYKKEEEIVWQGKRIASFLLAGKHYYKLRQQDESTTILEHGEYFTGLFSYFIAKKLLKKMEEAFIQHNIALKKRIENGK